VDKIFSHAKPRWFTEAWRDAGKKDFTWHCLRHSWATRLVRAGVDLKTVQELGGWKSITTVARYALADEDRLGPALEKLCATTTATEQTEGATPVAPAVH